MVIDKLTSLESSLKELTNRVEDIERRLSRVEKNLIAVRAPSPVAPLTSQGEGATEPSSGMTVPPQEPPKKRLKSSVPKEKEIADGLKVVDVDYYGTGKNTFFKGEIENNTGDDIVYALFKIEVYGEQGDLLGIESFEVKDIKRAWPKKFTLTIYHVEDDTIADYSIKRLK
ncbi:MAG TPA: FxLYD domain-containing protein [Candidatus Hypogeohydataceae bacterium YC41]